MLSRPPPGKYEVVLKWIRERSFLHPLPSGYQVEAGNRQWRAFRVKKKDGEKWFGPWRISPAEAEADAWMKAEGATRGGCDY